MRVQGSIPNYATSGMERDPGRGRGRERERECVCVCVCVCVSMRSIGQLISIMQFTPRANITHCDAAKQVSCSETTQQTVHLTK